ncbi:MAG TPA: hypothetical protein VIW73_13825 [Candidatus Cybelea sp.]
MAAAASLSMLAACTSAQQVSQTGASGVAPAVSPVRDCGGSGGVRVAPCPIVLTRHTKAGIVVTVSGPNVVNSYLTQLNGCSHHKFCYNAHRAGSSYTQWRITSGKDCGGADVGFDGVDGQGTEVGHASLEVSNRFCR